MNNEELFIDNERVDTDGKTKVTLDIKSNLLQDISKIVSNHTYTIKLPKTTRNQRIVKHADLVQGSDDFAYNVHKARFFRNGVEVIKNGRAVMMQASDDIEISVVWGLFPAFSELVSKGTTLNQLESDARILWTGKESADTYANAQMKDYFYANINVMRETEITTYWNYSYTNTQANGQSSFGGSSGGRRGSGYTNLHPCVKASWVLAQILQNKGIEFRWTGEAKNTIDDLIIPLVNKKSSELTFLEKFQATLPAKSGTTLGALSPSISQGMAIFSQQSGTVTELVVTADVMVFVEVKCSATYNMTNYQNKGTKGWSYDGCFVDMKVTKPDGEVHHYNVGSPKGGKARKADFADFPNNTIVDNMTGTGVVELESGDRITFSAYYCKWNGFGGSSIEQYYGQTTPTEYSPQTTFHGGTIEIGVTSNDGNVPEGGYYPIAFNLPNIKIIDFVKFLACITGTFPLQIANDSLVQFVPLSTVWNNTENALDWTAKVVAPYAENKPKEMEYKLSEWKQHNRYKWKDDDTVKGDYDGDLRINNETLELERDVFTFPFAATDGDRVPMYEKKTDTEGNVEYDYKACKDRILRLTEGTNSKAAGVFDINMQSILDEKYKDLIRTLQDVKVLKERIILSDAEIQQFDETKPVYLAQYGRYFAVIEIKSEGQGVSEVTLLQLNLES